MGAKGLGTILAGVAAASALWAGAAWAGPRTMVFDMELVDTSGEGVLPGHADRIERTSEAFRRSLAEAGYEVMDPAKTADAVPADVSIHNCNGCEIDIGREAGAQLVATGYVHKVSTLILSVTLEIEDVATGKPVATGVADIRGDNDRAWIHGVTWLVKNRLAAAAKAP